MIGLEKQGVRTAWDITSQKCQGVGLKMKAFILTFRDLTSHLCQEIMRVAGCGDLECESFSRTCDFSKPNLLCRNLNNEGRKLFKNINVPK